MTTANRYRAPLFVRAPGAWACTTSVCWQRCVRLGILSCILIIQMAGDSPTAVRRFREASKYAKEIGFAEGRREADEAIRRHRGGRAEPK